MKKNMKILLSIPLISSVAIAAPNISATSPAIFNGADEVKTKTNVIKPINIDINAPAWVSINYRTGDVVSSKNMNKKRAPASLTKIMTAYIVASELKAGSIKLNDMVSISHNAHATGGSKMFIREGDSISVKNLLTGMIVDSGNDATIALAEYIAGSPENFTKLMNQTAKAVGMNNTKFANPDGLPGGEQYTTAYDMATLARSFIYNFPKEYKLYSQKTFTWEGIKQSNRNRLLFTFDGADGMKTGHTDEAGYNLVASATKDGERFITVVLGTTSATAREQESAKLLRYSMNKFDNALLYKAGTKVTISADGVSNAKKGQSLEVYSKENIYKTIPKNYIPYLKQGVEIDKNISAPIKKGTVVGNLVVTVNNAQEKIASVPVIANNDIKKKGWW